MGRERVCTTGVAVAVAVAVLSMAAPARTTMQAAGPGMLPAQGVFMAFPAPRLPDENATWNERFDAGGPTVVSGHAGGAPWSEFDTWQTAKRHGLCGNEAKTPDFVTNTPKYLGLHAGDVINVTIMNWEGSSGYAEVHLCPDADSLGQSCLSEFVLERVVGSEDASVSPIDYDNMHRFYVPPTMAQFDVSFKLPDGVSCDHCVLQFHFVSSETCIPPRYEVVPSAWYDDSLADCTDGSTYPEEFWTCADIRIDPKNDTNTRMLLGYVGSWARHRPKPFDMNVDEIDASLFTHLIFAFAGINEDHQIEALSKSDEEDTKNGMTKRKYGRYALFHQNARKKNPQIKTLLSVGGHKFNQDEETKYRFSDMAASTAKRATFISSLIAFVRKHRFDGIDIDWEYPGWADAGGRVEDKDNFVLLLRELRTAIDTEDSNLPRLLLSVAVPAGEHLIRAGYYVELIYPLVDWLHLMTYDMDGPWNKVTGPHTALLAHDNDPSVERALFSWTDRGTPPYKIVLGVATYGRGWTLSDPDDAGMHANASGPSIPGPYTKEEGLLAYFEIVELIKDGYQTTFHEPTQTMFAVYEDQWISYDSPDTAATKGHVAKQNDLLGAFIWSVDQDDYRGNYPIASALRSKLGLPEPTKSGGGSGGELSDTVILVLVLAAVIFAVALIVAMVMRGNLWKREVTTEDLEFEELFATTTPVMRLRPDRREKDIDVDDMSSLGSDFFGRYGSPTISPSVAKTASSAAPIGTLKRNIPVVELYSGLDDINSEGSEGGSASPSIAQIGTMRRSRLRPSSADRNAAGSPISHAGTASPVAPIGTLKRHVLKARGNDDARSQVSKLSKASTAAPIGTLKRHMQLGDGMSSASDAAVSINPSRYSKASTMKRYPTHEHGDDDSQSVAPPRPRSTNGKRFVNPEDVQQFSHHRPPEYSTLKRHVDRDDMAQFQELPDPSTLHSVRRFPTHEPRLRAQTIVGQRHSYNGRTLKRGAMSVAGGGRSATMKSALRPRARHAVSLPPGGQTMLRRRVQSNASAIRRDEAASSSPAPSSAMTSINSENRVVRQDDVATASPAPSYGAPTVFVDGSMNPEALLETMQREQRRLSTDVCDHTGASSDDL